MVDKTHMAVGRFNPSFTFRIVAVLAMALFGCATPAEMTMREPVQQGPLHELGLEFLATSEMLTGGLGAMYESLKTIKQEGQPLPPISYVHTFNMADGTAKQLTITTFEGLERVIAKIREMHTSAKEALSRHDIPQLSTRYMATASPQCSEKWFASGEVNVEQISFVVMLAQGEKNFLGTVVESAVSVIFPGGFEAPLTGELHEEHLWLWGQGGCTMRLDPR